MKHKVKTVEELGWKDGTVAEFLELTPEEAALIEIKLALSKHLRQRRVRSMTQTQLAEKLRSSQSRVAKAESGHSSVSIELLVRAILATGATPHEIGKILERV
ncbi:MAG: helix-turn-helix transcriptional regulator [Abitibacteriaceae bacterium]|nr:helix-turn-helix transcriptional regulator [Abditibacteriaceae bacterium]MBV9867810.1 helix-turn-helix transcriptional regulator [Abditibacteriaceae bacterium]